jgi:hypothetical protein
MKSQSNDWTTRLGDAGVEVRRLDLQQQAGTPAQRVQHLLQRRHLRARVPRVEPRAGVQRPDLGEGQLRDRARPAAGEATPDVGGAAQRGVVDHDGVAVLGELDVHLDQVGLQVGREVDGGEGVLRCVCGGSAVGDDVDAVLVNQGCGHDVDVREAV